MACNESFLDLEVIQTDTKSWRFIITDKNKNPVDISGYLLFFTVKKNITDDDSQAVLAKTVTVPSNADSQSGIGFIELSSDDTDIEVGQYEYDMKIQQNSGSTIVWRKTIARGKFKVNATGTKRTS